MTLAPYTANLRPVRDDTDLNDLLDSGSLSREPDSDWEELGGRKLAEGVWEFDDARELVEGLEGQALSEFESKHPRWPKGTPKAGQFMHVGDRFSMGGHDYEIAHILNGKVVAHLETGNAKEAKTIVLDPSKTGIPAGGKPGAPTTEALPHEADVVAGVGPAKVKTLLGGKSGSNVTTVDPYVDVKSHDASIPVPKNSAISPEEWKRFGKVDQENYARLQEKYGQYSPGATKKHLDGAYSKYESAVQSLVKQAFKSQFGASSGWTLSLTALFQKSKGMSDLEKLLAQREKAKRLQREVGDAVQWDLYNRTRSPDVVLFHKSGAGPHWWNTEVLSGKSPAFSGLSQSFAFDANWGFGDTTVMSPVAIRHVTMSTFSAQPVPGESHFGHSISADGKPHGELEISIADQLALTPDKSLVFSGSGLPPNHYKWLSLSTFEPHGGAMFDQFKAVHGTGQMLPTPPAAPQVKLDGTHSNGKAQLIADLPKDFAQKITLNAGGKKGGPQPLAKPLSIGDLPLHELTKDEALPAAKLRLKAGDFVMGLQGTRYVIAPDPEDPTGFGFAYVELGTDGLPNGKGFNFSNAQTKKVWKLDGHVDWPKKQTSVEATGFDPAKWAPGEEQKFLQDFQPGEKFKVHANSYEVIEGTAPAGFVRIRSLENGKAGTINGDFKTAPLVEVDTGPSVKELLPPGVKNDPQLGPSLKHVKAAGGSTGAAFYEDPQGQQWVVKHYDGNEDRVATEALANNLLRQLGMPAPDTVVTKLEPGGANVIATRVLEGSVKPGHSWSVADKQALEKQFVAHALIANWDVVGLVHDNVLHGPAGATPIDQGGSFEYRAQGGAKTFGGDSIPELDSLRDPKLNPASASVFEGVTNTMIKAQAADIVSSLSPSAIDHLVDSAGFQDKAMADRIKAGLKGRVAVLHKEYAPEAQPGAKLLQVVEQGGAPQAKPGMVVAMNGKKATVTKILANGQVQLNLAPGVVKLNPDDPQLQGLHDPLAYATAPSKTKLKDMAVGQKFHGGTGAKVRPYQVVAQGPKSTTVRNLETGEVADLSRQKAFALLHPKPADDVAPAPPGTPVDVPPPVPVQAVTQMFGGGLKKGDQFWHDDELYEVTKAATGGSFKFSAKHAPSGMPAGLFDVGHVYGKVTGEPSAAAPFDPAEWESSGPATTLGNMPAGQHFLNADGDPHVVVATDGEMVEVKNLSSGKAMTLSDGGGGFHYQLLAKKQIQPSGQIVPTVDGFDPAHYVADPQGATTAVNDMELGTIFQSPKGGFYKLTAKGAPSGATAVNLVTGKPYPAIKYEKQFAVLKPKAEQKVPYEQLQPGDPTLAGELKEGDLFKAGGLYPDGPAFQVLKAGGPGVDLTVAPLGPNGKLGAESSVAGEFPVAYHGKAFSSASNLPFSDAGVADVTKLPSATEPATWWPTPGADDEGFQPYKSTHGPGGAYKHHKVAEMAPGTVFQDKGGKLWKVKQNSGPAAVITDGEKNFKVDPKLRGKVLEGKEAAFADSSPALGNTSDWEQSAVEQNLVPHGGLQMADLEAGDFFEDSDGEVWHVTSTHHADSIGAVSQKTGAMAFFDKGAVPSKVAMQGVPQDMGEDFAAPTGASDAQWPPLGSNVEYMMGGSIYKGQVTGYDHEAGKFVVQPSHWQDGKTHSYALDGNWAYEGTVPSDPDVEDPEVVRKAVPASSLSVGDELQLAFGPELYKVVSVEPPHVFIEDSEGFEHQLAHDDLVIPQAKAGLSSAGDLSKGDVFEYGGALWESQGSQGIDGPIAKMVQPGGEFTTGLGWKAGHELQLGPGSQVQLKSSAPPAEHSWLGSSQMTANDLGKGDVFWTSMTSAPLHVDAVHPDYIEWSNTQTAGKGTLDVGDSVWAHKDPPPPKSSGAKPDGMQANDGGIVIGEMKQGDHAEMPGGAVWESVGDGFFQKVYDPLGEHLQGPTKLNPTYKPPHVLIAPSAPDPQEPSAAPIGEVLPGKPLDDSTPFDPSKLSKHLWPQKVSEMEPGTVWQGKKGGYFQKLGETTVLNKNGVEQKAWLVKDLQTGQEKKTVAFALAGQHFQTFSLPVDPDEVDAHAAGELQHFSGEEHQSALKAMVKGTGWPSPAAKSEAQKAADSVIQGRKVSVVHGEGGGIVGILSTRETGDAVYVEHLASAKGGAGTQLMKQAAEQASNAGKPLRLISLSDQSTAFYKKLGMPEVKPDVFEWSSDDAAAFAHGTPSSQSLPATLPSEHFTPAGEVAPGDVKVGDHYYVGSAPKNVWRVVGKDGEGFTVQKVWGETNGPIPLGGTNHIPSATLTGNPVQLVNPTDSAPTYLPLKGQHVSFTTGDGSEHAELGSAASGEVVAVGQLSSGNPYFIVEDADGETHIVHYDELVGDAPQEAQHFVTGTDPETGGQVVAEMPDAGTAETYAGMTGGTVSTVHVDGNVSTDATNDELAQPEQPQTPDNLAAPAQFAEDLHPVSELNPGDLFQVVHGGGTFQYHGVNDAGHAEATNLATGETLTDIEPSFPVHPQHDGPKTMLLRSMQPGTKFVYDGEPHTVVSNDGEHVVIQPDAQLASGSAAGTTSFPVSSVAASKSYEVSDAGQDAQLADPFSPSSAGKPTPQEFTDEDAQLVKTMVLTASEDDYFNAENAVIQHLAAQKGVDFQDVTADDVEQYMKQVGAHFGFPVEPGEVEDPFGQEAAGKPVPTTDEAAQPFGEGPSKPAAPSQGPLQPYKSAWGSGGKYKHEEIGSLQTGTLFTDKSGTTFAVVGHAGGVTHYEQQNASPGSPQFAAPAESKVKLLGAQTKTKSAPAASLSGIEKAVQLHGSVGEIPDAKLQAYASSYGSGGKYKHHPLGDLSGGTAFVDKSGAQYSVVGKQGGWVIVHGPDGYGKQPASSKVKTFGVGSQTGAFVPDPKPPKVPTTKSKGEPLKGAQITESEAYAAWKPWGAKLSTEEKGNLDWYQADGYDEINPWLRAGSPKGGYNADFIRGAVKDIDSALKKGKFHKDSVVFRGVSNIEEVFGVSDPAKLVGGEFVEKGFVSTSISNGFANGWGSGALLRITVPKGARGAFLPAKGTYHHNDDEGEVLLPRGSKFRITAAHTEWGKAIIDLELLP